ncbi:hypothetical protein BX666DRAFT_1882058 [Dichotomocladium elegans]|nr:hypothetical protein BX666DRAFT_1882058 [Dichotomocladium elegans]
MKSLLLSAVTIAAAAANAAATITVISPWGNSVWVAGGHGNITWTTDAADANSNCEIQLMNGNASNSNMVAYVTAPGTPIKCSVNAYDIYPLNDFAAGDYWIRIGQSASNTWAYSGVFKFEGKGSANPLQLASNGASAPAAAAASGNPSGTAKSGAAAASGKATATSSATHAAQSDSAAGHLDIQGKTMAAVAGSAVIAALSLVL